jgi:AcrR family transcriptional regulator
MCGNMSKTTKDVPPEKLMGRLRQAFLDLGYEQVTMVALAKSCELSRRALYHHFNGKEDAFRGMLRWAHRLEIEAGMAAGERRIADGGSPVDALVDIFDTRYGEARRKLETSPHAVTINYQAFRRARDVMARSAETLHTRLAAFLAGLCAGGHLALRPGVTCEALAQLLCDGARGVNQSLPPAPATTLPERYRRICEAILYGCAEPPR